MKTVTISKQWRYLLDGHLADTTLFRTFRRPGVKKIFGRAGGWRNRFNGMPPLEKYSTRISSHPNATMLGASWKREPKRTNDTAIDDANIEQTQDSLAAVLGLLPAQPKTSAQSASQTENISLDMGGFSSIMLIEHPLAIVYITSCQQDNRMFYVSPQIANLGFTPEAWLGKLDFRLQQVYEEDAGRVNQAFRHSCATAEMFSCHYRLYDSAGKVHWYHDEASVVCDGFGAPLFIRGVMLDITCRKEMESELAQHRNYLERNVEMRTLQLVKRLTILESCNLALCDKLAMSMKNPAMLNQQPGRLCQTQHEESVHP